MARIGDQIRPELGRTNYGAATAGMMQAGAAIGAGIQKAGDAAGEYFKAQGDAEKKVKGTGVMFEHVAKVYEGTELGAQAQSYAERLKDQETPLRARLGMAEEGKSFMEMAIGKGRDDLQRDQFNRGMQLKEAQIAEAKSTRGDITRGKLMAYQPPPLPQDYTPPAGAMAGASMLPGSDWANQNMEGGQQFPPGFDSLSDEGKLSFFTQREKLRPELAAPEYEITKIDRDGLTEQWEHVKGQPYETGRKVAEVTEEGKPLTPTEKIAVEKQEQAKVDAIATEAAGVAATEQFVSGLEALKDHEGFEGLFGFGLGNSRIPGTDAYDAGVLLKQMDAKGFMISIKAMKGMGALSNAEGEKASIAFNGLDRNMSEKAAKDQIKKVISILKEGMSETKRIKAGGKPKHPTSGVIGAVMDAETPSNKLLSIPSANATR